MHSICTNTGNTDEPSRGLLMAEHLKTSKMGKQRKFNLHTGAMIMKNHVIFIFFTLKCL